MTPRERIRAVLNHQMPDRIPISLGWREEVTEEAKAYYKVGSEQEVANPERVIQIATTGSCVGSWDADRLSQLLSNLIGNAMDHGAKGDPIEVRLSERGDAVVIEFQNSGSPIPEQLVDRIDPVAEFALQPFEGRGMRLAPTLM